MAYANPRRTGRFLNAEDAVPWEKRYFKGDEVWVETDTDGEPVVEDGKMFMKYDRDAASKIYRPHADRVAESEEGAREAWVRELEEREEELEERAEQLETREQRLDDREEALRNWEERLISEGVVDSADEFAETVPPESETSKSRSVSKAPPDHLAKLDPPEPGVVELYTDGACQGNPGPAAYGVVRREDDDYLEWADSLGDGTNNIAELAGIKSALTSVDQRSAPVRIYTDSRYAIGVLTQGWNVNANQDLIEEIWDLLEEFDDVEIRKVEGHAGEPLNERADDLASEALPD